MRGEFVFWPGEKRELVIPNNVLVEGEEAFLKMITRGTTTDVAVAGNFYIGLCGKPFTNDTILSTLPAEPDASGGYARKACTRDNIGFPSITEVNGSWLAESKTINFAAAGADFSVSIWRAFLCNVVSGSVGKLFAMSGPLPEAHIVEDGETFAIKYRLWLR